MDFRNNTHEHTNILKGYNYMLSDDEDLLDIDFFILYQYDLHTLKY